MQIEFDDGLFSVAIVVLVGEKGSNTLLENFTGN